MRGLGGWWMKKEIFVDNKVTCADVVKALKSRGLSTTAAALAGSLQTSSRAVATALRQATDDGRVRMTFKGWRAWYRFVRLTPRLKTPNS
jgi:hypothetical protein